MCRSVWGLLAAALHALESWLPSRCSRKQSAKGQSSADSGPCIASPVCPLAVAGRQRAEAHQLVRSLSDSQFQLMGPANPWGPQIQDKEARQQPLL